MPCNKNVYDMMVSGCPLKCKICLILDWNRLLPPLQREKPQAAVSWNCQMLEMAQKIG